MAAPLLTIRLAWMAMVCGSFFMLVVCRANADLLAAMAFTGGQHYIRNSDVTVGATNSAIYTDLAEVSFYQSQVGNAIESSA